jgi:hypothetical protein
MLPPGGRNWQLIYPNYSVALITSVKKYIIQACLVEHAKTFEVPYLALFVS